MTRHVLVDPTTSAIVEVTDGAPFPVPKPMIWVVAPLTTTRENSSWDATTGAVVPTPPPGPSQWYVLKSTIRSRLVAVNLAGAADTARAGLTSAMQNEWLEAVVIHNDDPHVIALLRAIGADPAVILAPDPGADKLFGLRIR